MIIFLSFQRIKTSTCTFLGSLFIIRLDFLLDWLRTVFILSHWRCLSLFRPIVVLLLNQDWFWNSFFWFIFWKFNQINLVFWRFRVFNNLNVIFYFISLWIFPYFNNLKIWTVIIIIKHNDIIIIIRSWSIFWFLFLNLFVVIFIFFDDKLFLILYLCLVLIFIVY